VQYRGWSRQTHGHVSIEVGDWRQNVLLIHSSSTPGSANYGKHMSPEEVVEFFAPPQSTADAVMEWLASSGISADRFAISANKQVLLLPHFPTKPWKILFML
jgi:subtilase family serine protease